jgi:hypothetical protein
MTNEATGEKYLIDHKGVPIIEKPRVDQKKMDNKVEISITARNMEEARKILNGLSKKYKNLDVEELLKKAQHIEKEIAEPLHITLTVGGKDSMPAILKMALNYYIYKTGDNVSVCKAIDDLKNNRITRIEPIVLEHRLYDLDETEVSHSIYLRGSKSENKLFAVIELFNAVNFIVKLSEEYNCNNYEELYVFDVLECKEKSKVIKYHPTYDFIFTFEYPKSNPNFQIMQNAASRILLIAMQRQQSAYINKMIKKAWDETINESIPDGGLITPDAANRFATRLAEDYVKFHFKMLRKTYNNKDTSHSTPLYGSAL